MIDRLKALLILDTDAVDVRRGLAASALVLVASPSSLSSATSASRLGSQRCS